MRNGIFDKIPFLWGSNFYFVNKELRAAPTVLYIRYRLSLLFHSRMEFCIVLVLETNLRGNCIVKINIGDDSC